MNYFIKYETMCGCTKLAQISEYEFRNPRHIMCRALLKPIEIMNYQTTKDLTICPEEDIRKFEYQYSYEGLGEYKVALRYKEIE